MTNKSQPRIRVLCVDDHPVVREGLTRRIAIERDMTVVGTAATGEEAQPMVGLREPKKKIRPWAPDPTSSTRASGPIGRTFSSLPRTSAEWAAIPAMVSASLPAIACDLRS